MPHYSQTSKDRLSTVDERLQLVFNKVIEYVDCTIISGLRTAEEQAELYAQGRTKPGSIVTYKDGINSKSNHQSGLAVDVIIYHKEVPHLRWKDDRANYYFAGTVLGIAKMLGISNIRCGGDWDMDNDMSDQTFMDVFHFELV